MKLKQKFKILGGGQNSGEENEGEVGSQDESEAFKF